ncbi:MAG: cation-transporting P-type ATPase, partial [Rhodothermales bacterium]
MTGKSMTDNTATELEEVETPGAGPPGPWHTLSTDVIERHLEVGDQGLSDEEIARRRAKYGPNEIEQEREKSRWSILLHQFNDPLIYILIAAAFVTFALQDFTDTGVIMAVVVLNAAIGYVQEVRAQQAMRALSKLSAPKAEVFRDGR